MKPLVLLVHGFNVFNPEKSVGKLRTFFESQGCPTIMVDYGHTGLIETRLKNPKIAKRLAKLAKSAKAIDSDRRVIAVGHSNGCAILHLATNEHQAPIDKLVYINPALKKNLTPGIDVYQCDVWHSPSDKAVKWSRVLAKIIPRKWFNARPWGKMGAVGYVGDDRRMNNFDKENDYVLSSKAHSDVFKWSLIGYFGQIIADKALETIH